MVKKLMIIFYFKGSKLIRIKFRKSPVYCHYTNSTSPPPSFPRKLTNIVYNLAGRGGMNGSS